MIKDLRGAYVPNDRNLWLKLKKDYLDEAETAAAGVAMADSVDLVAIGAFWGTGAKVRARPEAFQHLWVSPRAPPPST